MGSWNDILNETKGAGSVHDLVRRKYLKQLHEITGRNVIAYYSGWLQKPSMTNNADFGINDSDKNGFMAAIYKLDRNKGLDLLLHTPGGGTSATESIVEYLRSMFGPNIRAIIPQLAMSAGTMIALSCKEILMGKHSSLGPVDPQFGPIAAAGVVDEFERAKREIKSDPSTIPLWQQLIAKYPPAFIGECDKALQMSAQMTSDWLKSGMFLDDPQAEEKAKKIIDEIGSHDATKAHDRHISISKIKLLGIKVTALEDDQKLQDAVLSVHHAFVQTLAETQAMKIIENHQGSAYIDIMQQMVVARA